MRKRSRMFCCMTVGLMLFLMAHISLSAAEKQTIYNSPYVSFAPDGKAWTTNAGDRNYIWYNAQTTVPTGIASTVRELQPGEHYYRYDRAGEIPIGKWQVSWAKVNCCHNSYPPEKQPYYHGISYTRNNCFQNHYSGWRAYCADCGEQIERAYIYMSKPAAESIDYFEIREDMDYYYLCPFCNNLEQGVQFYSHKCKDISWNQYKVQYETNLLPDEQYGGYMPDSYHMYNNATEYEGKTVTPITHLTLNSYTRIGYEFVEWNTKPDGSGQSFQDGQEILNLTDKDWKYDGTVILYAQWRKSTSTLRINPNGGSYNGKTAITEVTGSFGNYYKLMNDTVKAPKGYTVSFQTNGGSAVASVTSTRHFTEWIMVNPFNGRIKEDSYYFLAPDGNVDTIVAGYELDSIILPSATKPGSSFGGWYYDPECTDPAGGPGDKITPSKDITLYAGWVELKLFSEDNYTVNGGKGAVDLSWTQSDNNNKTYKVYQSKDNVGWKLITSAKDIGNQTSVSESFRYTGSSGTYTVPYSGLYTLTAYGAQGGNYGANQGGYGGSVTAKVWLQKGEKITYTIGGQSGYNGGGTGSVYGNGGGATTVTSDRQGTLLIAGGGGGASVSGAGGAGGSDANLRSDNNSNGASGQTGGGAGYVGGNAGEYITHSHTSDCYIDTSKNIVTGISDGTIVYVEDEYHVTTDTETAHFGDHAWHLSFGTQANPIAVDGCTTLKLQADLGWSDPHLGTNSIVPDETGYAVYNQNGQLIYQRTLESTIKEYEKLYDNSSWSADSRGQSSSLRGWTYRGIEYVNDGDAVGEFLYWLNDTGVEKRRYLIDEVSKWGVYHNSGISSNYNKYWKSEYIATGNVDYKSYDFKMRDIVTIPEGTTGIYIKVDQFAEKSHFYDLPELKVAQLTGGVKTICGYTEGQIVSSKPAYGGSSYINTSVASDYSKQAGVRAGNGAFSIRSESVGYLDVLSLKGVVAADYAAPENISAKTVTKEALSGTRIKVNWQEPEDNGTDYYHVAESYLYGSASRLCRSNVTKNTLVSGIKGYYVLEDTNAVTAVNALNGSFTTERTRELTIGSQAKYLHVAAVDKAGNIGGTEHIKIEAKDVAWRLYTEPLSIEEADNVYPAEGNRRWYVRADGSTPFTLQHNSYMDGPATEEYQPNYIIYESVLEGVSAKNIIHVPSTVIQNGTVRMDAGNLSYSVEGQSQLIQYPYSYIMRADSNRKLQGVQSFTLAPEAAGKIIDVIPIVGANKDGAIFYSNHDADKSNGIILIGDGEAPAIYGLEILENKELINRNDGTIILNVTATDDLSGVKDFYLEITNTDNAGIKTYTPGADGSIRVEITKDEPIFSGSFIVAAYVADNVGNERIMEYGTTEFALQSGIERILMPHDPVFKCGESGILTITTWGYADRIEVEFPSEFVMLNPELNRTYVYTDNPQYKQVEQLQFMVPLDTPENQQYIITVRAYKGDKKLEDFPSLSTIAVDGNVLDELRTRLR